jgi:hypothetical protein
VPHLLRTRGRAASSVLANDYRRHGSLEIGPPSCLFVVVHADCSVELWTRASTSSRARRLATHAGAGPHAACRPPRDRTRGIAPAAAHPRHAGRDHQHVRLGCQTWLPGAGQRAALYTPSPLPFLRVVALHVLSPAGVGDAHGERAAALIPWFHRTHTFVPGNYY